MSVYQFDCIIVYVLCYMLTMNKWSSIITWITVQVVCGLCYTKTKKPVEQHPRKPTQCAGPYGHAWGKNSVYFLDSSSQGRWIRIQSRHSRLRPEIEPVLCRRMDKCQYRENFSAQCMFPHSEEERLLWIYQIKAKGERVKGQANILLLQQVGTEGVVLYLCRDPFISKSKVKATR